MVDMSPIACYITRVTIKGGTNDAHNESIHRI
jgi:hypothetical protein